MNYKVYVVDGLKMNYKVYVVDGLKSKFTAAMINVKRRNICVQPSL